MFGTVKGRLLVIAAIIVVAVGLLYTKGINYGLDLRGGMHLALEVQDPNGTMTAEARRDAIQQTLEVLRNRMDAFGVAEPLVQAVGSDRIIVELPGIKDEERARHIIEQNAYLEWSLVRPTREFTTVLPRMDRTVAAALAEQGGEQPGEPADTTTGKRESVQQLLFGKQDSMKADSTGQDSTSIAGPGSRPLSNLLLGGQGDGEFLVPEQDVDKVKRYLALPGVIDLLPRGSVLRWGAKTSGQAAQLYRPLYFLDKEPFITGEMLDNATAGRDPQYQQTVVQFTLNRQGGRKFEQVTGQHIGDRIAIVLDTLVHSAPVVHSRIGASGQIEMGQSPMTEASDLALVLRAGALKAPLQIVEQRSVGPSLGRDSIQKGKVAGLIGIVLVIGMMVTYYRLAGMMAIVALAIYVLLVMGGLASFGAALTAPGIAGLILSIGMAVDANVLIFERIREELLVGRTPRASVDAGFQHAMSAIIDSNLTTLITAFILYYVGTGPVRGFAVTLSIGIFASFFSAVYITRTFFLFYLDRKRPSDPISV